MKKNKSQLFSVFGILSILLIWFVFSSLTNEEMIMPSIATTVNTLFELLGKITTYSIIMNSVGGMFLIIIIAFLIVLILIVFSYRFKLFKSFITPLMSLFKVLPVPAIIIFLLVHFNNTIAPYILTSMVIIPLLYEGLYGSIMSIEPEVIDDVKTYTNINIHVILNLIIPTARIGVITSLLQSFGVGLKVKIMTEFISNSPKTIGYQLNIARSVLNMNYVFAWTIILVIIVVMIDLLLNYCFKKTQ